MKKLIITFCLLFLTTSAFAQQSSEQLTSFDNSSLPVLNQILQSINQQLRKTNNSIPTNFVISPATNHDLYVPQWNGANSKTLKDGLAVGTGANNLVANDSSGYIVGDGRNLTNLPIQTPTQVNTSGSQAFGNETTIMSVAKTITSGHTVLLIASGYLSNAGTAPPYTILKLKNGSTVSQTVNLSNPVTTGYCSWSACAIVTGLSGSVTFSVTAANSSNIGGATCIGNLIVMEF
jgi:hypothetical protein